MQKKLSLISKRLVRHFAQGKPASIKNMWMFHISNCSREVIRNYELIFGISLNRKIITWNDEF
jgi:hypothetical protein